MEAATGPVAAEPDRGLGHDLFLRVGVSLHQLRNRANLSGRATARKVSFTEAFGSELHTAIPAFLRRLRVGLRSRQRPSRLSCARLGVHNCIAGRKKRYDQQDSQRISHHGHPATTRPPYEFIPRHCACSLGRFQRVLSPRFREAQLLIDGCACDGRTIGDDDKG